MKDYLIKKTTSMEGQSVDDLSSNYECLGILLRKQLDKEIIHNGNGPWLSVAFKYQNKEKGEWKEPRVMLAFFKKINGIFKRYSYFNVRSKLEGIKVIKFLTAAFDIKDDEV